MVDPSMRAYQLQTLAALRCPGCSHLATVLMDHPDTIKLRCFMCDSTYEPNRPWAQIVNANQAGAVSHSPALSIPEPGRSLPNSPGFPAEYENDIEALAAQLAAAHIQCGHNQLTINALGDRIRELEAALREAKEIVKVFHDMGSPKHVREEMWTLYQQSPEMKRLNAALSQSETGAVQGGELTQCDGEDSYEV